MSYSPFDRQELITKVTDNLNDAKYLSARLKLVKKNKIKVEKKKKSISTTLRTYAFIDTPTFSRFFKLKNLKTLGVGATSMVFDNPKQSGSVVGITLDNLKIKWLYTNKSLFNFQLLDVVMLPQGKKAYVYTMNKIEKTGRHIPRDIRKRIYDQVVHKFLYLRDKLGWDNVKIANLDYIMYGVHDKELTDILKKLKRTFPRSTQLDLHQGQFGTTASGKILLFDPVFSVKVEPQNKQTNNLGSSLKIRMYVSSIFSRAKSTKSKEIMDALLVKRS